MRKDEQQRVGFRVKEAAAEITLNDSRTISGYAAVFGNKDRDGDIIVKGAFAKSINDRGPESAAKGKIMFLWQHERTEPLGRITKLYEDDHGLYFEAEMDEVEISERALKQLQSGTLNQFSIGFSYVSDGIKYSEEQQAYIISNVKLYEISVVSIASNTETEFLGMKGMEDNSGHDFAKRVESVCKGLPIEKQEDIQRLVTRAQALTSAVPSVKTHEVEQAAEDGTDDKPNFFDCFI